MNSEANNLDPKKEKNLIYSGADKYQPTDKIQEDHRLYPYSPSPELREAVNLAIYLKRPLLIKGEPGSGKTRLAYAVAHEFSQTYYKEMRDLEYMDGREEEIDDKGYPGWPFFFWSVKSTSLAQDGLYVYDAVGRLQNATLPAEEREQKEINDYIDYGPLGKAFHMKAMRPIVLIDEIDKADIDFPNDLLIELEDPKFKVKELKNKVVEAAVDPIIFVTSNDEKDLPDAFLRRCIFHYIKFPTDDQLENIIRRRIPEHDGDLVVKAVDEFLKLRTRLEEKKGTARKLPSTSELIDWVKALHRKTELEDAEKAISAEEFQALKEKDELLSNFEDLGRSEKLMVEQVKSLLDEQLPFLSVLIKNWNDYSDYIKEEEEKKKSKPAGEYNNSPAGRGANPAAEEQTG
jgi:MoxR-like ATPase